VGRANEEGRSLILLDSTSQGSMVSRMHAFISFSSQEGAWRVVDNNSMNGLLGPTKRRYVCARVYWSASHITRRLKLKSAGDVLTFGGAKSTFTDKGSCFVDSINKTINKPLSLKTNPIANLCLPITVLYPGMASSQEEGGWARGVAGAAACAGLFAAVAVGGLIIPVAAAGAAGYAANRSDGVGDAARTTGNAAVSNDVVWNSQASGTTGGDAGSGSGAHGATAQTPEASRYV
jgi:hypothetical protein